MFFSAVTDQNEDYEHNDVIKFHKELVNVNPGFPGWNPTTNIFTCPFSGYYFFTVTLYKSSTGSGINHLVRLHKSDGFISELYNYWSTENAGTATYSSTMSAIVPCEQGMNVWAGLMYTPATILGSDHRNQFSGMLIREGFVRTRSRLCVLCEINTWGHCGCK